MGLAPYKQMELLALSRSRKHGGGYQEKKETGSSQVVKVLLSMLSVWALFYGDRK